MARLLKTCPIDGQIFSVFDDTNSEAVFDEEITHGLENLKVMIDDQKAMLGMASTSYDHDPSDPQAGPIS